MEARIPEKNKRPGVCYAVTEDGIELPVIDITHPAFAFEVSEAQLNALIEQMQRSAAILPAALQAAAQKSILVRGMLESAGTFTTGMMTYLNKLEPENLGEGYAGPLDRQWAAGLTPVTFRWRMRHVARLLAEGLAPALAACPQAPLHLLNIAGGPAADSLNALILLYKQQPALLAGRPVTLHVLDIDRDGPAFGSRALAALQAEGGPLYGLQAEFDFCPYDWAQPENLGALLASFEPGCVAAGSTEGGLFEYASDSEIVANLQALHEVTPLDFCMVGPVVRDEASLDPRLQATAHVPGRPAVRYLGLAAFRALAAAAGWQIEAQLDGPMHQVVRLVKL